MANQKYFDPSSIKLAKPKGTLWQRVLPWAIGLATVTVLLLALFIFLPVIEKEQKMTRQKEAMELQREQAMALSLELEDRKQSLDTDPVYIETKARDVLQLGREGETIFRFPPYPEKSSVPEAP